MKKYLIIIAMMFFFTFFLPGREKTLQVGKVTWYSEQNTFKEILAVARKEKKPVLAFFTAAWCKPCQAVKKEVFSNDDFQKVAKEVVLLYIEQTDPKSGEYLEKHRVRAFPTFKLFTPQGLEYDAPYPKRSPEGFLKWIQAAKSGKFETFESGRKTRQIGNVTWHTGQNDFQDILEIARKENKPILVVFDAKRFKNVNIKNDVLSDSAFQEAAKGVIPLYIDFDDANGREFAKKLKANGFPFYLIFSKDGQELDANRFIKTGAELVRWMNNVKAGKGLFHLEERLKKEPTNRELIMDIVRKGHRLEIDERIQFLNKAIELNPDFNDLLTQEAYERVLREHASGVRVLRERALQQAYAARYHDVFVKALKAYYPDKFKYSLEMPRGYSIILTWFGETGKYTEGLKYLDDYLKNEVPRLSPLEKTRNLRLVSSLLLNLGREKEAEALLTQLGEAVETESGSGKKRTFLYTYIDCLERFVDYYAQKSSLERAKTFANRLFRSYSQLGMEDMEKYRKLEYARKYLVFATELIKEYENQLKEAEGIEKYRCMADLAPIYARKGEKEKTQQYVDQLYQSLLKETDSEERKRLLALLGYMAKNLKEAGFVNRKTLGITKKYVEVREIDYTLDLLAEQYAALGNYRDAVACEEKALSLASRNTTISRYRFKIELWKSKIKE
ncbi:MAG: thioredoxin family protein [Candidatus Aminicenantes bacterium]|nr:MAG: thioredoxin family protein [Candidatus Aminicenantes bacterium]